jgi:hypothetical protein
MQDIKVPEHQFVSIILGSTHWKKNLWNGSGDLGEDVF